MDGHRLKGVELCCFGISASGLNGEQIGMGQERALPLLRLAALPDYLVTILLPARVATREQSS